MPRGIWTRTPEYLEQLRVRNALQSKKTPRLCPFCQRGFKESPSNPQRFCTRSCYLLYTRGQKHPGARGLCRNTQGYLQQAYGDGRRLTEHRRVAERVLGRPLKRSEIVHHINGDKTDNRNSNLLICSVAYHQELHAKMSYLYQVAHFVPIVQGVV